MSLLVDLSNSSVPSLILSSISLLAIGFVMVTYLNYNTKSKLNRMELGRDLENYYEQILNSNQTNVVERVSAIEEKLSQIKDNDLNLKAEQKIEIIEHIKSDLISKSSDLLLKELSEKIEKNILKEMLASDIRRSIARLEEEKNSLFKRGNFNLVIGVLISGLGGYIAYLFIQKLPITGSSVEFLSYSLPRISLFMLIALLVFFFLNLYKRSLDDIKYYQNEMTNLEAKYLALQIARNMNNHKMISLVLESLIETERNFILEKGQSTVEIQKNQDDSNAANKAIEIVRDIFKHKN